MTLAVQIALSALIALCILIFAPQTQDPTLIKELLWWAGLPAVAGCGWLLASRRARLGWLVRARRLVRRRPALLLIGAAWFAWNAWAAWRSPDRPHAEAALARLAGQMAGCLLVAILMRGARGRRRLVGTAGWACGACALYMFAQYLGYDIWIWLDASRPLGTFGNPNFSAATLAAWLPLLLVGWAGRRRPGSAHVLALGLAAAVLVSQSRAGLLGLVAGGAALAALWPGTRKAQGLRRLQAGGGYILLALGLAWVAAPERLVHLLATDTIQLRFRLWRGALQLWLHHPACGWGLECFRVIGEGIKHLTEPIAGDRYADYAHNWLLEMLVEHGVVGTSIFGALLFLVAAPLVRCARRARPLERAAMAAGILAALAALLGDTLFCVWLSWWGGAWTLWLLLGLGLAVLIEEPGPLRRAPARKIPHTHKPQLPDALLPLAGGAALAAALMLAWLGVNLFRNDALCTTAERLYNKGRWREGLALLDRASHSWPRPERLEFLRAECCYRGGDYALAAAAWSAYTLGRPVSSDAWIMLGCIDRQRGRREQADQSFQRAFAQEPSGDKALALATYFIETARPERARQVMRDQLSREVYLPLLESCLKLEKDAGRTAEARDFLAGVRHSQTVIIKREEIAALARWEGELSALLGDWQRAAAAYGAAVRDQPGVFELWNELGRSLKRIGRLAEADQAFAKAEALDPRQFGVTFNRLELAVARRDVARIREFVKRLRGIAGLPPQALERLAFVEREYLREGR